MRIFYTEKTYFRVYKLKFKIILSVLIVILVLLLFFLYGSNVLIPSLNEIADNKVSYEMTRCINEAVLESVDSLKISYNDIISIDKSEDGSVKSVTGNIYLINKLKSEITLGVLEKTSEFDYMYIDFPLIQLFKNSLFRAGFIRLKVMCYVAQTLEVEFYNQFKSAGINQTNSVLNINVTMKYKIITPASIYDTEVKSTVPVAYTVIVGDVPDSYVNVESDEETFKDDILQLAPN